MAETAIVTSFKCFISTPSILASFNNYLIADAMVQFDVHLVRSWLRYMSKLGLIGYTAEMAQK